MVGDTGDDLDAPVSSDDALRAALPAAFSRARVVVTPYPFVAAGGDYLRVITLNSLVGVTLEIHGRQAARGFEGTPFRFVTTPLTNRMPKTEDYPLNAGLVTNLAVFASAGSPLIGQTFVIVQLVRSVGNVAFVLGTLLQGYVTSTQGLGWPGSPIESSIEGGGYYRTILGTQPAAGAGISETVPTGARWQLCCLQAALATAAGGANRVVELDGFAGAIFKGTMQSPTTQPPSTSMSYVWAPNLTVVIGAGGNCTTLPWPDNLIFTAGDVIITQGFNIAAGDQWTAPRYTVREWMEAT